LDLELGQNDAAEFDAETPSNSDIFKDIMAQGRQLLQEHAEELKKSVWSYLLQFIRNSMPMIEEIKNNIKLHSMNVLEAVRVAVKKTFDEMVKPNEKRDVTDDAIEGEFKDQIAARIRNEIKNTHADFTSYFKRVWGAAKSHFKEAKDKIVNHHKDLTSAVSESVQDIMDGMRPAEFYLDENDMEEFADEPTSIWGVFKEIMKEGKAELKKHMNVVKENFFVLLKQFYLRIKPHLGELTKKLKEKPSEIMKDIGEIVNQAMSDILKPIEAKEKEEKLENDIKGEFASEISDALRHATDLKGHFSTIYQRIIDNAKSSYDQIKSKILDHGEDLKTAVKETAEKVLVEAGVDAITKS
jgi:Txe/YoeB family toxin of Txe-Axe toxin-antitoxin module